MNMYARSADAYLIQRVLGAGPEQQAALLMEAGQRFVRQAAKAIDQKMPIEASRCLIRVSDIIHEAYCRLNHEEGGELVQNLTRIYGAWTSEIQEASRTRDLARLESVAHQMGELREAWEKLHEKRAGSQEVVASQLRDRVV